MRGFLITVKAMCCVLPTAEAAPRDSFVVVAAPSATNDGNQWLVKSLPIFLRARIEASSPWLPLDTKVVDYPTAQIATPDDAYRIAQDTGARWIWVTSLPRADEVEIVLWWATEKRAQLIGRTNFSADRQTVATDLGQGLLRILRQGGFPLVPAARAAAAAPETKDPYALLVLGRALRDYNAGETESARAQLERAIKIDPSMHLAARALAEIAEDAGELETARRYYQRAANGRQYFALWSRMASVSLRLGSDSDALAYAEQVLRVSPHNVAGLLVKGQVLTNREASQRAIRVYDHVLRLEPRNPKALRNLALELTNVANIERLAATLTQLKEVFPADVNVRLTLAATLRDLGNAGAAADEYRGLIGLGHDPWLVNFFLADLGEPIYRNVPQPRDGRQCLLAARSYELAGDAGAAIQRLYACISFPEIRADALVHLGAMLLRANRAEDAVAIMRSALPLVPQNAVLRTNYGIALFRLKNFAGARQNAQLARRQDPDLGAAYHLEAAVLVRMNQFASAHALLMQAIARGIDGTGFHQILLLSCRQLRLQEAERRAASLALIEERFSGGAGWLGGGQCER